MKTHKFTHEIDWLQARRQKITGTRLKDIVVKRGTKEKIGYYELIAERLCTPADNEQPMERGHRLENEAIELFAKQSKKTVNTDLVLWTRDDNENIALSPDGIISESEAVEIKCLSSARHIEAYLTKSIPEEYQFQALQYFIVNEQLEKLYFVFYDPRFVVDNLKLFWVELTREEIKDDVETYLEYQKATLIKVEEVVNSLSF